MSPIGGRRTGLVLALTLAAALAGAAPAHAAFGYISFFGRGGSAAGELNRPAGVAADAGGNVYVADRLNHRVQKFAADGTVSAWGWGVQDGTPVFQICTIGCRAGIAGAGNGQLDEPSDVATDAAGNVYVAELGNVRVQKFASDGTPLGTWTVPGPTPAEQLNGIATYTDATSKTFVYVSDGGVGASRVTRFDSAGVMQNQWGGPGFGAGQFDGLSGIAADAAGNAYTVEGRIGGQQRRVQVFEPDGDPIREFSSASGQEAPAKAIEVDAAGVIYVTDETALRRFSSTGVLMDTVSCVLRAPLWGVGAHPSGNVYVSTGNSTIFVFGEGGGACSAAPAPLVFSGAEGVTINDGDEYANDPDVTLTITPPGGVTQVLISNDGGFAAPATRTVATDGHYAWRLFRTRFERLAKTVYVRFAGQTESSALTFTDDIVLDETDPNLRDAVLSTGRNVTSPAAAAAARRRAILRVRARDNASGVAKMQLARCKRSPGKLRRFRRRLAIRAARPPSVVRVRDGAGNFSKWRRIRGAPRPACPRRSG